MLKLRARLTVIAIAITLPGLAGLAELAGQGAPATAAATPPGHSPRNTASDAMTHSAQVESMFSSPSARSLAQRAAADAAPPPGASAVQGVDVSSHQHSSTVTINWSQVAGAGYKFAFVKATESDNYVNPYAASDLAQAAAAGLYVAPYAFAIPSDSGAALQADYALDHSGLAPGSQSLPMILDIEYNPYGAECYGLSQSQMVSWISTWIGEVVRRTGRRPAIYSTADWWKTCTGNSTALASYPLWIAGDTTTTPVQPIMPPSWTTWTYWQYGTASVSGISGAADVSYLSASALQVLDPPGQSNVSGAVVNLQVGALTAKTVSYSATGLPPGLSINQTTGQISGTLQGRAASFPATVTVTPTSGSAVTQAFTWNVHGGVRMTAPSRTGTVGSPIIAQIAATDALPGCTLHLAATGLPPGLSMTGCGKIFGWPTKYGQFQVNVTASDSAGQVATASFGWRIYGARNAGPVGLVHLNSYRCLNSGTGSTVVGGTCTGSRAGKWTIVSDGTLRLAGKCLAATGSVVTLASCSSGAIHWQLGGGYGTLPSGLVNLTTGQCLNDPNSSQSGARVNTASCSHGTAQRWLLPAGQIASGVPGYCLSDYHRSGPVTQQVNVRKCAPSASQTWTVQPSGQVQIGTYCLSLAAGGAVAGRHAVLATCGSAAGQFWELYGGPEGVWLVNPGSGLCLADPGDRAKAGNGQALGSCQLSDPGVTWRVS